MKIIHSEKKFKKALTNIIKKPFPYVIIDNFLNNSFARNIYSEFPDYEENIWHSYNNYCEKKKTLNNWNFFKPYTYQLFSYLNSQVFINKIQKYLTKETIFSDDGLHGAGLSIMKNNSGKLNPHLDNSIHPKNGLLRKYNLILFINKKWGKNDGGCLNFYNSNKTNKKLNGDLVKAIEPVYNRCVIFDTSMNSWHGVGKISKNVNLYRKSIQIYYFVKKTPKNKRLKVLYAPLASKKKNKKILNFIKKRSSMKKFSKVYIVKK